MYRLIIFTSKGIKGTSIGLRLTFLRVLFEGAVLFLVVDFFEDFLMAAFAFDLLFFLLYLYSFKASLYWLDSLSKIFNG